MTDGELSVWPLITGGGTAMSSSLDCGYCFHQFLDNSGEWEELDDPTCTAGELIRRIEAHAPVCPDRPRGKS